MPKICYVKKKFIPAHLSAIDTANEIIEEFEQQGFELTLRQLYYQFVARGLIENTEKSYKNLGSIINDGRLAGLIDWDKITDRTRHVRENSHWGNPQQIIVSASKSFRIDLWKNQGYRPEVWIEKDALVGVIEGVCRANDVPFFSCRGYTSQSEMWAGAMRLKHWTQSGQEPIIFHFGDHDPSGKDMTRDIVDRMNLFGAGAELERLALNMDQIKKYNPPPNPAKITDSRAKDYIAEFGQSSWELDALNPKLLVDMIQKNLDKLKVWSEWNKDVKHEKEQKELINKAAVHWPEVVKLLKGFKTPKKEEPQEEEPDEPGEEE